MSMLTAREARGNAEIAQALALRAAVFVQEMGANGGAVAHPDMAAEERDRFDAHATHLVVMDQTRPEGHHVVGTTRIMDEASAAQTGGFYSAGEFDLAPLLAGDHSLIEVGRTCLHPEYRGGAAMVVLWQALAVLVSTRGATLVFGTASFPGADARRHQDALTILHRDNLAPPALRVRSVQGAWQSDATAPVPGRLEAMRATPALIKSYLRLGGVIGDGVFVDTAFNTTDVCMILDAAALTGAAAKLYAGATGLSASTRSTGSALGTKGTDQ